MHKYGQKSKMSHCYYCGNKSSTIEHVPPKSLFPESKDLEDEFHRKNLITVPSCKEHNTSKSSDDEFLMIYLGSSLNLNETGKKHFETKLSRAWKRKNPNYISQILENPIEIGSSRISDDVELKTFTGKPNIVRFNRCMDSICRALYFHNFGFIFRGEIRIVNNIMFSGNAKYDSQHIFISNLFDLLPRKGPITGDNPEVFTYQFSELDDKKDSSIRLKFYMQIEVLGTFKYNN